MLFGGVLACGWVDVCLRGQAPDKDETKAWREAIEAQILVAFDSSTLGRPRIDPGPGRVEAKGTPWNSKYSWVLSSRRCMRLTIRIMRIQQPIYRKSHLY